jgi:acyl-CoA reductase-like NAD-dependent aldehyde dehydrogenase
VVLKPSEYAARVGAEIVALFEELGVPGLVGLVQGAGDTGARLVGAEVDHVVFTGSVATGRQVAAACAERLVTYNLELGGNDPALVLADADIDRAVEGIVWSAFANAGQNCSSVERVYVVEAVAQQFIDKILARTERLIVGDGQSDVYDVGPLVRSAGLQTVRRHVDEALGAGATVRIGGKATGVGLHYEPTVLTDVDDEMTVMTQETLGPVMPIAVVRDEDEAIARANRSVYGLTASVWTRDLERGRKIAARLKCGVITINNHAFTAVLPDAPWHGRGHSGGGVTNSRLAFLDLVEPRYVLMDRSKANETWWFPHNTTAATIARALAQLFSRGGNKLEALLELLKNFPKRWT